MVDDCGNNQYSIDVNITDIGSGATAGVRYSVNGGANVDVTGLGLGVETIGPFTLSDVVAVTLLHGSDAQCNIALGTYDSSCPIELDLRYDDHVELLLQQRHQDVDLHLTSPNGDGDLDLRQRFDRRDR